MDKAEALQIITDFWNDRYAKPGYVYGDEPNDFFRDTINTLPKGSVLIPAAGQGRDAVYAASLGWEVKAFDLSYEGQKKALELAAKKNVSISFEVLNALDFKATEQYDFIALIYFHLAPSARAIFYKRMVNMLKPGGTLIVEAFNPMHKGGISGGPQDPALLISTHDLASYFPTLTCLQNEQLTIEINVGLGHTGTANIVRYLGTLNTIY